jgi:hypothetical protein
MPSGNFRRFEGSDFGKETFGSSVCDILFHKASPINGLAYPTALIVGIQWI